jgi:hypothetical protein
MVNHDRREVMMWESVCGVVALPSWGRCAGSEFRRKQGGLIPICCGCSAQYNLRFREGGLRVDELGMRVPMSMLSVMS